MFQEGRDPWGLTPNCGLPEYLEDVHVLACSWSPRRHHRSSLGCLLGGGRRLKAGETPAVRLPVAFGHSAQFAGSQFAARDRTGALGSESTAS